MDENIAEGTLEERVAPVTTVLAWKAVDLLRLFGAFLREDKRRKERTPHYMPVWLPEDGIKTQRMYRDYNMDEKYVRAFLRVATHPRFQDYETHIRMVYEDQIADSMMMERVSEFEIALNNSLLKEPFNPGRREDGAKDAYNALIPVSTCSKAVGVTVRTMHRWIDAGLGSILREGELAVKKQGSYYWVNYFAALQWKETKGRKFKKEAA